MQIRGIRDKKTNYLNRPILKIISASYTPNQGILMPVNLGIDNCWRSGKRNKRLMFKNHIQSNKKAI